MKIKNLLLGTIVTTMALTACEKSEDTGAPKDQMPKSVTITLPNLNQTTRATGNAMGAKEVALENFQILFLDAAGAVQDVPQYDNADQKTYFDKNDEDWKAISSATSRSLTYHFLPAATTQVVVIGNLGEITKENYNGTVNDMRDVLNDSEGHPLYPLYGQSELTLKSGAEEKVPAHTNVYTAAVTLAPQVARLEVYGFQYSKKEADADYDFDHLELAKIALSNYSTQYKLLDGTAAEVAAAAKCPTDTHLIWDWVAAADEPWATTLTGKNLAQGAKVFVDGTAITAENEQGDNATGIITFGLAKTKDKNANNNPELLLSFYGAADAEGTNLTPLYLRAKFTNVEAFAPGKIYRVLYPIEDGSWKLPERCVELTVTVADWTIVPVTPTF